MKYLKYFENNNSIEEICKKYHIQNYTINEDESIDVESIVDLYNENLSQIPLKFNIVEGNFDCSKNPNLKSLKGAPKKCKSLTCYTTAIETLEYSPEIVSDSFNCLNNPNLKSLKGAPKECKSFYFGETIIESLEYAPEIVSNNFNCSNNPNLKSLKGAPKQCVYFVCEDNPLIKSFEGLENTTYENCNFSRSPIDRLYYLFNDPDRIKEFIDLEITDGEIVKQYRLEHFLYRKLTSSEITNIEKDYYLL